MKINRYTESLEYNLEATARVLFIINLKSKIGILKLFILKIPTTDSFVSVIGIMLGFPTTPINERIGTA